MASFPLEQEDKEHMHSSLNCCSDASAGMAVLPKTKTIKAIIRNMRICFGFFIKTASRLINMDKL